MRLFERLRAEIDAHIAARLPELPAELGVDVSANGADVYERLREFAGRPGKRIRGALTMVAYQMFGGRRPGVALEAALAVELVQNYLLIVDDVMDRSALRRGGPTLQVQYGRELARMCSGVPHEHLGNMLAVNAGLIDHHLSMLVLGGVDEAPARVVRAMHLFQTNIAATGFGQMDDLWNEAGQAMGYDDVRHMYRLKTSYYSFVNPLQLGAVLAGAADSVLEPLRIFGEQAGLAFQLQDDILGMFGDAKTTGKSAMDDLREGKRTLLVRHGLDNANPAQSQVLRAALGNPDATARQHTAVKRVLTGTGSREYVEQQAHQAAYQALAVLGAQDWDVSGKRFLADMLKYVITRKA